MNQDILPLGIPSYFAGDSFGMNGKKLSGQGAKGLSMLL